MVPSKSNFMASTTTSDDPDEFVENPSPLIHRSPAPPPHPSLPIMFRPRWSQPNKRFFFNFASNAISSVIQSILPTCHFPPLPVSTSSSRRRRLTGTLFGPRKGRVTFAIQSDPRSPPGILLELVFFHEQRTLLFIFFSNPQNQIMGSADTRSKRRDLLWKKAILHFSLCFVMGFFSGFAPQNTTDGTFFSGKPTSISLGSKLDSQTTVNSSRILISQDKIEKISDDEVDVDGDFVNDQNRTQLIREDYRKLLILVTTTTLRDPLKMTFLRRLSNTLKLVPPPILWIVVEGRPEAEETAEMLRMTGIMYRHLVFNENFTDTSTEIEYQRNLALEHVEHHRLDGIVHFAEINNVYDLLFFDRVRNVEELGTWPVASVSANRKRVAIEGPVCRSTVVMGFHERTDEDSSSSSTNNKNQMMSRRRVSSFAFNSSILWDPERWGRPSVQDPSKASMISIKFVLQVVLEEESKLIAFPSDCTRVMIWNVHVPRSLIPHSNVTRINQTYFDR